MAAPEARGHRPGDGPRGDLAASLAAQGERLDHCVHCGFCLPACPTYLQLGDENDSPRGRLHLMGAVVEGRLDPTSEVFRTHIDRCLGCRACETACPAGVEYGVLLEHAREEILTRREPDRLTRGLLWLFPSDLPRRLALAGGRVLRSLGVAGWMARRLPDRGPLRVARWGLAMLASTRPVRWKTRVQGVPAEPRDTDPPPSPAPGSRGRVALLAGCVQEGLYGRVNRATRRVLEANGWEVVPAPGQGCCGALHAHAGDLEGARELARRNVRAFQGVDWVVMNAAGCGAATRGYEHLLESDPDYRELAAEVARKTLDVSVLLTDPARCPGGIRRGAPLPMRVALDHPCHLEHGQGVRDAPARMLQAVPGLEVVPLRDPDRCCGGAGIYGITHPDLGGRIGGEKVDSVLESGAQVLATGNPGCMMQIGGGLLLAGSDMGVAHPVEILDESYRRAGHERRQTSHE